MDIVAKHSWTTLELHKDDYNKVVSWAMFKDTPSIVVTGKGFQPMTFKLEYQPWIYTRQHDCYIIMDGFSPMHFEKE